MTTITKPSDVARKPRGFAAMTPERRAEIASMGGKALPANKRAFSVDSDLASRAGRIGGSVKKGGDQ